MSEFDDSHHAGKDEKLELKVGESYQMKIIKLIPTERKVGLSIRALKNDEFRADWEAYTGNDWQAGSDAGRSLQASELVTSAPLASVSD